MPPTLSPSPKAEGVLGLMIERRDIQRSILEETLKSEQNGQILESGRTLCSSQSEIKGPISRFPRAVDLQRCPISGGGGAWHTHVTPDQLLNPENSLPDIGAVVFGQLDVIAVVGAESAEYVMSTGDSDEMAEEFRDAIGADVTEQGELVSAVETGRVNPMTARDRVRQRMGGMFTREDTGFSDLVETIRTRHGAVTANQAAYERVELAMLKESQQPDYATSMAHPKTCNQMTARMAEGANRTLIDIIPESIKGPAVGAAVGTVVGNIVNSLFFDK